MSLQRTLAIIKSGAVARGDDRFIHLDFIVHYQLLRWRPAKLTAAEIEALYDEHRNKPFYGDLFDSVNHGVVLIVMQGEDVIHGWRGDMGATNSSKAERGTIRHLYGNRTLLADNAVHGSDSPASATREINLFFPDVMIEYGPIPD